MVYYNIKLNKLFKTNINVIKQPEYTSYYSSEYKYPLLVIENLKTSLNKPKISFVRSEIEDPFRKYEGLDKEAQYSVEDYQIMKKYGLSPGHNAPAGHHKSSMKIWSNTFYHINMTPQDIVLNAGVWLILEQWCYYIANNPIFKKLYILTGSIPAEENKTIENLTVNIPTFMYKIVLGTTKKKPGKLLLACFLYPNKPIVPEGEANDISKYLISINKLNDMTDFNIIEILNLIIKIWNIIPTKKRQTIKLNNKLNNKISNTKKRSSNQKILKYEFLGSILRNGIQYNIKSTLLKSLINAKYFGLLIHSKTLDELEKHWNDYVKKNEKEKLNRSLEYHKEYYELAKQRIISNKSTMQLN
jgi:DNA/RNA endonuclease G (NUC1)